MTRGCTSRLPRLGHGLSVALLCAALTACSAGETPRKVEAIAPADTMQQFGNLRVRYNALPSLSMNATAAQAYGIERGAGRALVVIALRRMQGNDELPAQGDVSGSATDLSGRRQPIAFRIVRTGDYLDQIGVIDVSAHDTLRFVLEIRSPEGGGTLRFERTF
ncbi:DUF4426 domain-containing protein [Pseudoxanthomonas sp.]|uniref:DUF4426 domain-containing protein n=1 Tax=Pseudoxanthomonas sp. TaxID=1871049 RepID=UPI002606A343|nr:DUF4426 domain-containing protein [Pseudoxanthomonas sp.]WDS37635.1 MAG: DUF4426 domain-containing protein [Pseudoxanthomonas sp.]